VAGATGAAVVVVASEAAGTEVVVSGAVVVVDSPLSATVLSVVALVAGSVTVPLSATVLSVVTPSLLLTSAIRVLARVVPVSAMPAAPPPSSPAVRP
jgi:hypothetical protein